MAALAGTAPAATVHKRGITGRLPGSAPWQHILAAAPAPHASRLFTRARLYFSAKEYAVMPLSAWLRVLAAVLGLTKSKPADIKRAEEAAQVVESVDAAMDAAKQQPPPAEK